MTSHRRFSLLAMEGGMLLAALAPSLIGIAHAQGLGTIVGTITDPSGALVPGATVRVTDEGTSQSRETTTNAQGY
jgi:Carboxypeptidase regulatory-like domain